MKKSNLRSALGRIRPSEELITKTLDRMESEKLKKVPKFETRQSNFSFAYRLAGAMCALILIIGAGVYFGHDTVVSPTLDSAGGYQRAAFNADVTETGAKHPEFSNSASSAAETLASRAKGNWDILEGEVIAAKCSPENTIMFSIIKHHASSSGYTFESGRESDTVGFEVTVPDGEVMKALTESMGSIVCVTLNTDGDVAFITDYVICE